MVTNVSTNRYGVAQLIVAPTLAEGANYTTIASALTDATSGQTIFIRPGTYTENITLKAGVDIVSFNGEADTPNVIISGTVGASYSGTATISNIRLQTNSANNVSMTGANATVLNLNNCYLNCTNNTGISSSGSNAASSLVLNNCRGDLGTTGIALFSVSNGVITFNNCSFTNSGASTTTSTISSTAVLFSIDTQFTCPITSTNTAQISLSRSRVTTANVTGIVSNATGTTVTSLYHCILNTGSATPMTIGAGSDVSVSSLILLHSNAAAISGLGSLTYSYISQNATVGTISPSTILGKGTVGKIDGVAPALGYIGQVLSGNVAAGSAVSLTSTVAANITSVALTPGTWMVWGLVAFTPAATATAIFCSVNATTATFTTNVIDYAQWIGPGASAGGASDLPTPVQILTLNANATYYLNAQATFTSTCTAYGKIQAVRIA